MAIDPGGIHKVLAAFDDSEWDEIHLSDGESELHLIASGAARSHANSGETSSVSQILVAARAASSVEPSAPPVEVVTVPPDAIGVHAPSMGVFYRCPSPGSPPFVELGDVVAADSTLGIVEVMKLMNPILAGRGGTVIGIHVGNADRVERDQLLLTIDPA
jgi:acetyl-CoA carboxylase biotin carboxyl carrier protein